MGAFCVSKISRVALDILGWFFALTKGKIQSILFGRKPMYHINF